MTWRGARWPTRGLVVAREDLGLEAAFWAQFPGKFRYRARAGGDQLPQFRGLLALPHPSRRQGRRQPLGPGGRAAADLGRLALLLQLPSSATSATPSSAAPPAPARPSSRTSCWRSSRGSAPAGVHRQGPRRRDLRARLRRDLSHAPATASRPASRRSRRWNYARQPRLPGRTGPQARHA